MGRVERLPWLNWKERSVSLRLSLHQLNPALVKLQRLSRGLSVRLRNLLLPREKTERIRTACLTWLPNCKERSKPISSRLRKLRRCSSELGQVQEGSTRA